MKTVADYRRAGMKVRVKTFRFWKQDFEKYPLKFIKENLATFLREEYAIPGEHRSARGGLQIVEVKLTNGTEVRGWAACSLEDDFDRSVGLSLALQRATNEFEIFATENRTQIVSDDIINEVVSEEPKQLPPSDKITLIVNNDSSQPATRKKSKVRVAKAVS